MILRTGAPVVGCDVSGASEKLCFTSNCSLASFGDSGTVSYKYVGMLEH